MLAGIGIAAAVTLSSFLMGILAPELADLTPGADVLAVLWFATIAWTVAATIAHAFRLGFRRGDWSAFGGHRFPQLRIRGVKPGRRTTYLAYKSQACSESDWNLDQVSVSVVAGPRNNPEHGSHSGHCQAILPNARQPKFSRTLPWTLLITGHRRAICTLYCRWPRGFRLSHLAWVVRPHPECHPRRL